MIEQDDDTPLLESMTTAGAVRISKAWARLATLVLFMSNLAERAGEAVMRSMAAWYAGYPTLKTSIWC